MNLIVTGPGAEPLEAYLREAGHIVHALGHESLAGTLRSGVLAAFPADAVVFAADTVVNMLKAEDERDREVAERVSNEIAALPESATTADGRKYSRLPFHFVDARARYIAGPGFPAGGRASLNPQIGYANVEAQIQETVDAYRKRLLGEFDNHGFLVVYDRGRYRVRPALQPAADIEGELFYARADDLRNMAPNHYWTIDREHLGLQYEIDLLEESINNPNISEPQLQAFFEVYPHLLTRDAFPIPHPRLTDAEGKLLIPDFLLRPIVSVQRDINWEIRDLKLPQQQILAHEHGRRPRFSAAIFDAIVQLRDYRDYFRNEQNADTIRSMFGQQLRFPKLAVLVGRMPNQVEALERNQAEEEVRIITYDEILEDARRLAP
jgi:hypothetical protein